MAEAEKAEKEILRAASNVTQVGIQLRLGKSTPTVDT